MDKKRNVTLGQKVFILSGGSEVVCTMVGRITDTDYYTLLNGWDSSTPHRRSGWHYSRPDFAAVGACAALLTKCTIVVIKK